MLVPLHALNKKNQPSIWGEEQDKAFEEVKRKLTQCQTLVHYDHTKEIVIMADASDKEICGVLCHIIDGVERPVFFFSRCLNPVEKNYPILHREALAFITALEKFNFYIYFEFLN